MDEQTKSLNIEFVTFNAEVNLFAYVFVRADFHESGRILMLYVSHRRRLSVSCQHRDARCLTSVGD